MLSCLLAGFVAVFGPVYAQVCFKALHVHGGAVVQRVEGDSATVTVDAAVTK